MKDKKNVDKKLNKNQNAKGKFVKGNTIGNRFTTDNQPTEESKIKAIRKSWMYRKARKQLFEKLCDIEMPDGTRWDFWEIVVKKIQSAIAGVNSTLTDKEKVDLAHKLIKDLTPEDKNIDVDISGKLNISFDKEDEKL